MSPICWVTIQSNGLTKSEPFTLLHRPIMTPCAQTHQRTGEEFGAITAMFDNVMHDLCGCGQTLLLALLTCRMHPQLHTLDATPTASVVQFARAHNCPHIKLLMRHCASEIAASS